MCCYYIPWNGIRNVCVCNFKTVLYYWHDLYKCNSISCMTEYIKIFPQVKCAVWLCHCLDWLVVYFSCVRYKIRRRVKSCFCTICVCNSLKLLIIQKESIFQNFSSLNLLRTTQSRLKLSYKIFKGLPEAKTY